MASTPSTASAGVAIVANTRYVAVVGSPAPMTIQDKATRTNVINKVAECTVSRPVGSTALSNVPKSKYKVEYCPKYRLIKKPTSHQCKYVYN